ncbi:hypothetical protein BD560DRAFT_417380 [Blakeslea trispora]|nr:hypothetical protein BD560DRAFT_417380 [Blakeslea trispora]
MTDNISMPPPPKKRKRSSDGSIEKTQVPTVPLPPPLVSYHPHFVPSYFPVYHQHPYYLSVAQPPASPSLSPNKSSNVQRILPKSPTSQPHIISPSLGPTLSLYPMQLSPQIQPSIPNTTTADQREQARKMSHSAIERRRRERINDKILQLKELIPSCADRHNLHKMTILQSAIDYIVYLKGIAHEPSEPKQTAEKKEGGEELEEEEEDDWSNSPLLSSSAPPAGLKPMDLMKLGKQTPSIQIDSSLASDQALGKNSLDRNMNLENILC